MGLIAAVTCNRRRQGKKEAATVINHPVKDVTRLARRALNRDATERNRLAYRAPGLAVAFPPSAPGSRAASHEESFPSLGKCINMALPRETSRCWSAKPPGCTRCVLCQCPGRNPLFYEAGASPLNPFLPTGLLPPMEAAILWKRAFSHLQVRGSCTSSVSPQCLLEVFFFFREEEVPSIKGRVLDPENVHVCSK